MDLGSARLSWVDVACLGLRQGLRAGVLAFHLCIDLVDVVVILPLLEGTTRVELIALRGCWQLDLQLLHRLSLQLLGFILTSRLRSEGHAFNLRRRPFHDRLFVQLAWRTLLAGYRIVLRNAHIVVRVPVVQEPYRRVRIVLGL